MTQFVGAAAVLAPAFLLFFIGIGLVTVVAGLVLAAIAARTGPVSRRRSSSTSPGRSCWWASADSSYPARVDRPDVHRGRCPAGSRSSPSRGRPSRTSGTWWPGSSWANGSCALRPGPQPERPYLAAVVGLVLLQVVAIVPLLTAVASIFGLGAVLLLAWRVFRSGSAGATTARGVTPTTPQPMPS